MENRESRGGPEAPAFKSIDLTAIPLESPEDGIYEAYSNVVFMDWTLYDLRLRFCELMQVTNQEDPSWKHQHGIALERAAIRVPWHQAKLLRDMLETIIKNYEEINGELKPIQLPDPEG